MAWTRAEFDNEIIYMGDLVSFVEEEWNSSFLDYIYSSDEYDTRICNDARYELDNYGFNSCKDFLENVPPCESDEYYEYVDGEYFMISTDRFYEIKDDLRNELEEDEYFAEEEDEPAADACDPIDPFEDSLECESPKEMSSSELAEYMFSKQDIMTLLSTL